jgi:hypothetical protein
LKNTEKFLEREFEELCKKDFDTDVDKTIQDVKRLEKCAKDLDSVNFNSLHLRQQDRYTMTIKRNLLMK